MTETIDLATYVRTLARWTDPTRRHALLPRRRRDRWILLHAAARTLDSDAVVSEREVTDRLERWLAGPGKSLEVDPVSLRRALVDEGFVERDAAGSAYRRSRRHESRVRFEDGTEEFDPRDPTARSRPPTPR